MNIASKIFSRFGVKARLLSAFCLMVTLTVSVGGVGWWGVSNIQQALNTLQQQSLPEVAEAMTLAEHSASLVAQAPLIANAKILFHLDEESARLKDKLNAFNELVLKLGSQENETAASELDLDGLAGRIEKTLLELVEVTRSGIFLSAEMHDREYHLIGVYETLETRLGEQEMASALGEVHRMAGALTAAVTAESAERLLALEARFQRGGRLLRQRLTGADSTKALSRDAEALFELGAGANNIFELRRRQFEHEDRRAYLLTVSNILSAQLNERVAGIVEQVKQTTEQHSAAAASVLNDSKLRILLLGLICLGAAIVSAAYVVRDLGGNLSAVTRAMMGLAEGDRRIEVPAIDRPDEIGSLARAFDVFKRNTFALDETSRRLAENNRLLEAVFENMNDGLAVFDADNRLISWNQKMLQTYGLSAGEVRVGMRLNEISKLRGRNLITTRSLDGRLIEPDDIDRERQRAYQRFEEYLPNGHVLELRSQPMPEGGFVTLYTDLTERKEIEDQLRQAQKMESVGQLTGGLAHDFNNLLTAIIGNLSLLQEELEGQDKVRKKTLRALEAAERGAAITQRLLAFSRKQRLRPRRVAVNDLIEGMLDLLECSLGAAIGIETTLEANLWPALIDPGQLENSLMNIALNSRDAMPEGGRLSIHTRNLALDEAEAKRGLKAGEYVVVTIQDTGIGMPAEVLEHAFEPFFTTKEVGAGSGLGLSMVYGFIRQSGGYVHIDSSVGQGTTIELFLPRLRCEWEEPAAAPEPQSAADAAESGGATVLVVEDDASVREVALDMLAGLGCLTIEAGNGKEALEQLDKLDKVSVLFTDVVLPGGMSGPELAREARRRKPEIGVLYCSGYPRDKLLDGGYLEGGVDLLEKPYTREALAKKLRDVLANPAFQTRSTVAVKI